MDAQSKKKSAASAGNRTLVNHANASRYSVQQISIQTPLSERFKLSDKNSVLK
jgi:hypothetical protein